MRVRDCLSVGSDEICQVGREVRRREAYAARRVGPPLSSGRGQCTWRIGVP